MLKDTIITISTPAGFGGLGVIRLSGKDSLRIARALFRPKRKRKNFPPRYAVLGDLYDKAIGERFEEALLTYFPAQQSYTTEDVVELSCHGSPVLLAEIIRIGTALGARLALPGEFTLRAYLGGRIDIIQAEAVNDLIRAASIKQAKISYRQLEGSLSGRINTLRQQLVLILTQLEAAIEFPDEALRYSPKRIAGAIKKAHQSVALLVDSYDIGKSLAEGLSLAIIGRTNVGKSTLFNSLLEQERAIVTPYPGTTRDYLSEKFKIHDSIFSLLDTAGLDDTSHPIEQEGIRRSRKLADVADGILLLLDSSRPANADDLSLIKKFKERKIILLFNKIDLPLKMDVDRLVKLAGGAPHLQISALKGENITCLKDVIHKLFVPDKQAAEEVVLHVRQKLLLEDIQRALAGALQVLEAGYPDEICAEEVRKTLPLIGQLTGEIRTDEILNNIFSRFCIGK